MPSSVYLIYLCVTHMLQREGCIIPDQMPPGGKGCLSSSGSTTVRQGASEAVLENRNNRDLQRCQKSRQLIAA